MKSFALTVSTPDGHIYRGEAVFLALRGTEGDLAILAGHTPFVTSVVPCEVRFELPDETEMCGFADGGLLTVAPEGVTLLTAHFTAKE